LSGTLYIVATPIGNTEDLSARAKRILAEADIVAAEDTRTTKKLLGILGSSNKVSRNKIVSNHKFNEKQQLDYILSELGKGKNVALVSEAGTPCISDPGGIVVKAAVEQGIPVEGIPGASAVITALSISGFCFNSFSFFGFLPRSSGEIKKTIDNSRKSSAELSVFFESPKRIKKTLEIFSREDPDAAFCLCNDLTKMFQRIYRGTAMEILEELLANPSAEKGEYTLVARLSAMVQPAAEESHSLEAMLVDYMVNSGSSVKDAVQGLAEKHRGRLTKKDFYSASLKLRGLFSTYFPI
jgi:16S rRNA (cytidine1402-2'-O)-methyltransferase